MDMDTVHQSLVSVRLSREFGASTDRLFAAWADPAARARFVPIACGTRAEVSCVEVDRPHRLAFDVQDEGASCDRVTVELAPLECGTLLVLIHETGMHRAATRSSLAAAWNASLVVLDACLRSERVTDKL